MDDSVNIDGLTELGLTRYEAQSYLALIGRGDASPADVARLAGLPRQRVYDVLASLAERGLVTQSPDNGARRYRARPPDEVTRTLLAVRRRELDVLTEHAAAVTERLLPRFADGRDREDPLDFVEVLRDARYAVERIEALWSGARQEVLTLVQPPYLAPPAPEDAATPPVPVKRAIYDPQLAEDPDLAPLLGRFAELGEEVRLASDVPMKLTIVDGISVAFNLPDPVEDDGSVTTLVIHHAMLAAAFKVAFDAIWATATPLDDVVRSPP